MSNNLKEEIRKALLNGLANHTDEFLNPGFIPGMSHEELAEVLERIMNSRLIERVETLINQKEKELLDKFEEMLEDQTYPKLPTTAEAEDRMWRGKERNQLRKELRDRIKQLKEELKGGEQ